MSNRIQPKGLPAQRFRELTEGHVFITVMNKWFKKQDETTALDQLNRPCTFSPGVVVRPVIFIQTKN